jgi:1-aminocyclopropane-1-carboxylate deaminase/D-cysteine desulfhydrase-like pyridoxal-dependent ACC family enzyme
MFRPADGLAARLPRVALGNFPTPLEPAPRLATAVGGPLLIKREDLSSLALGGNKTRQLEALIGAAIEAAADCVVASAAAQSNFCRIVAAAGTKLGLPVHLLLRGSAERPRNGNLLLDELLGAHLDFIDARNPYDPTISARLEGIVAGLRAARRRPHLLHMTGAAAAVGAAAHIPMAEALAQQFAAFSVTPAGLCLVAGSGPNAAGLLLGFSALGLRIELLGICAQTPPDFLHPLILRRAREAADWLGLAFDISPADLMLDGAHVGPGYGIADAATVSAIELTARTESLILDPVYTGKCLAGLITRLGSGPLGGLWRGDAPVMFVHSGGAPGLFAYGADRLAEARRAQAR